MTGLVKSWTDQSAALDSAAMKTALQL